MRNLLASAIALSLLVPSLSPSARSAEPQASAAASPPLVKTLNTPREFPKIDSRQEWQARAKEIREHVLVCCGLWPLPEKTPLHAQIFGKVERDGYSIERVYIETLPGFYLGGNLYRPLGHGNGPFPAILNPHGHWKEGRLGESKDGCTAGRCITLARQGMIAFTYDMVGYNDTIFADYSGATPQNHHQRHHSFATSHDNLLWNISLMGLQTWNSIRALDFIASLPDADTRRLACTGESGGGTQTFMLGSVEDRLAAQAPVVMVSHTMQGGCLCENAPGLRVEYSNMEIAARPAPRSQILVAATGDWTKDTPTVEGPCIAHIYELLNARDKFNFVRFDFGHNYNQTSREAVYAWFGKWLLNNPDPASLKEPPFKKEADTDLWVFPDGKLPEGAATEAQIIESLKNRHRKQWASLAVRSRGDFAKFKQVIDPAWRHTLQLYQLPTAAECRQENVRDQGEFTSATLSITRSEGGPAVQATYWAPGGNRGKKAAKVVVLCNGDGASAPSEPEAKPAGLPLALLQHGLAVLKVNRFSTGTPTSQFANFYSTYNRTLVQERVQDLLTVCAAARSGADPHGRRFRDVILCGSGRAGLWALLAAPGAETVIADCDQLDAGNDGALLAPDLFCPGIRNIGTFEGAAMLAAPHPILVHNTGTAFTTDAIRSTYQALGANDRFRLSSARLSDDDLVAWLAQARR
jgi:hypothetical protein